jgi:hypothetical protein
VLLLLNPHAYRPHNFFVVVSPNYLRRLHNTINTTPTTTMDEDAAVKTEEVNGSTDAEKKEDAPIAEEGKPAEESPAAVKDEDEAAAPSADAAKEPETPAKSEGGSEGDDKESESKLKTELEDEAPKTFPQIVSWSLIL